MYRFVQSPRRPSGGIEGLLTPPPGRLPYPAVCNEICDAPQHFSVPQPESGGLLPGAHASAEESLGPDTNWNSLPKKSWTGDEASVSPPLKQQRALLLVCVCVCVCVFDCCVGLTRFITRQVPVCTGPGSERITSTVCVRPYVCLCVCPETPSHPPPPQKSIMSSEDTPSNWTY